MRQRHELGGRRSERRRVGRMAVDDGADVGAGRVDAGVQDGFEMEERRVRVRRTRGSDTSPASTSSSATPLRLIQISAVGGRALTWPSVRSA